MPRPKRIDYPGAWHHVMNRGARRETVFLSDGHVLAFYVCLGLMTERFGVEIHAFVLMPNHYHLLVRSARGNLSKAMQFFGGEYTRRVNFLHHWDGPIFKARFRNQLITDEQHLLTLLPYIHLNPCRAGLSLLPQDYLWSSFAAYAGLATPQAWLNRSTIINLFGSLEALLKATEGLRIRRDLWPPDLDLDTGTFIGRRSRSDEEKGTFPGPELPASEVLLLLEDPTSSSQAQLVEPGMGRIANPLRRLTIWALRKHAGLSHKDIAKIVNISPPAVTLHLARMRKGQLSVQMREWMMATDERAGKR